jgi:hypothetical protein
VGIVDRFIGELGGLRSRVAEESLTNVADVDKTAFGFGRAVGRLEGLRLAEEALNRILGEQETEDSGTRRHRSGKA